MKLLSVIVLSLAISGCSENGMRVPLNAVEKANELCNNMGGAKNIRIITENVSPRFNDKQDYCFIGNMQYSQR